MPSREGRVGWELWGGVCRWGAGLWRVASRRSCLSWVSKAGNGEDGCLSVSVLAVADKVNYCAIIPPLPSCLCNFFLYEKGMEMPIFLGLLENGMG